MRRALLSTLVMLAGVVAPGSGRAQDPPPLKLVVTLRYALGDGAAACPGEEMLHQEVGRRIGYDPFTNAQGLASGAVSVKIARGAKGLIATYEYANIDGALEWSRTYEVSGASKSACEIAVSGVAVDLAMELVHRKRKLLPPPAIVPEPVPPPAPPAPSTPPPPPPAPVPEPARAKLVRPEVAVGMHLAAGIAPSPAVVGFLVHAGLGFHPWGDGKPWFSLAGEGRYDAFASRSLDDTSSLSTSLRAGSGLFCGHMGLTSGGPFSGLFLCAIGTGGVVNEQSGKNGAYSAGYGGLGARFGLEALLGGILTLRVHGEVVPTIDTPTFSLNGQERWRMSAVTGSLGVFAAHVF